METAGQIALNLQKKGLFKDSSILIQKLLESPLDSVETSYLMLIEAGNLRGLNLNDEANILIRKAMSIAPPDDLLLQRQLRFQDAAIDAAEGNENLALEKLSSLHHEKTEISPHFEAINSNIDFLLGELLTNHKRMAEAVSILKPLTRSIYVADDLAKVYYYLGLSHSAIGSSKEAIRFYQQSLKHNPKPNFKVRAHFGLAVEFKKLQKRCRAQKEILIAKQKASDLDSSDPVIERITKFTIG